MPGRLFVETLRAGQFAAAFLSVHDSALEIFDRLNWLHAPPRVTVLVLVLTQGEVYQPRNRTELRIASCLSLRIAMEAERGYGVFAVSRIPAWKPDDCDFYHSTWRTDSKLENDAAGR